MATKPPNQSGTKQGSIPVKGSKGKTTKKAAAKPKGYDWGDGRAVHSITLAQHQGNAQGVKDYGLTPGTPLDAPLTAGQAYKIAQASAGRTYDPQINANRQLQTNTPVWYQNYINQTGAQQAALATQAQPVLSTAQAAVGNAAQTAPGLDPSSPQYAKEQQAALGRQVMAQDSANYLSGVTQAGQNYLAGQSNVAARELPQAQAGLLSQYGQLQTQKQDAATQAYGDIRTNEQNASIARSTLGLNAANTAFDNTISRGVDPVTGKPLPTDPEKPFSSGAYAGYTPSQVRTKSTAWKDKKKDEYAKRSHAPSGKSQADKDAEKAAKDKEKKQGDIKKATGGVQNNVRNVISQWEGYVGQQTDDTSKPKDPKTGEYPGRNLTPTDIKRILGQKNDAGLIHVALLVRAGKPLDKAAIDYLHQKDPNIRVPREWLKGKQTAKSMTPAHQPPRYGAAGRGADST